MCAPSPAPRTRGLAAVAYLEVCLVEVEVLLPLGEQAQALEEEQVALAAPEGSAGALATRVAEALLQQTHTLTLTATNTHMLALLVQCIPTAFMFIA